jgi:glucokinase
MGDERMNDKSEPLFLGIDLGGTKILSAVVDSGGKMRSRDHTITPAAKGPDFVIQAILDSVDRALGEAGLPSQSLRAIGVGAPGLSNPQSGVLFTSPNLPGWRDVPLKEIIERKLGQRTFLINDANAAAVGEMHFGAAQGARNFIYITVSTGIGGGIVIEGEIYTGAQGTAGEVGHMTIHDEGPLCNCGNRGCWEMLASGTALARNARARIQEGTETLIRQYVDGDMERVTAEVVDRAARQGDSLARTLIERTGYYLGIGLANLINLFNPELIVVGGGLSNIGGMLLDPAYRVAKERAFKESVQAVRFVPAKLGRNSGVLGAAAFAAIEVEKEGKTLKG